MSPSVVIHRAQTIESALVFVNFLQSHGFDASLDNAGLAALHWGYIPALDGIAVRLPHSQLDNAREVLRPALKEAKADPALAEPARLRPAWRKRALAWSMLALYTGILQVALALVVVLLLPLVPPGWLPEAPPAPIYTFEYATFSSHPKPAKHEAEVLVFIVIAIGAFLIGLERVTRPTAQEEATGEHE